MNILYSCVVATILLFKELEIVGKGTFVGNAGNFNDLMWIKKKK